MAWPWSMMTIRSHCCSASSSWWVVRRIDVPWRHSSSSIRKIRSRLCGSTPTVGSSSSRTSGRWRTPQAMLTRRFIPLEKVFVRSRARSARPVHSKRPSDRFAKIAAREAVESAEGVEVLACGEIGVEGDLLRDKAELVTATARGQPSGPASRWIPSREPHGRRCTAPGSSCRRRWGRAGRDVRRVATRARRGSGRLSSRIV